MKIYLSLLVCFLATNSFAQQISNVFAKQEGKQVVISYDITGSKTTDKFEVKLYYAQGSNEWREAAKGLSGDIGSNITGGTGKELRWSSLQELNRFSGSDYKFKVTATYKDLSLPEPIRKLIDDMVFVEGGTFAMGCPLDSRDCDDYEIKARRKITLTSFKLCKYELTQEQWREVMGNNPSVFSGCDNCPIGNVTWNDVQIFLDKLNSLTGKTFRLPTSAEWEYTAKGGNKSMGHIYAGNNDINSVAWYKSNSGDRPHPVGKKLPNELGIYDMSGNVKEWCSDTLCCTVFISDIDKKTLIEKQTRIVRGGDIFDFASTNVVWRGRDHHPPDDVHGGSLGFRLAQDL